MIKEKREVMHPSIRGSIKTVIQSQEESKTLMLIKHALNILSGKNEKGIGKGINPNQLESVKVRLSGNYVQLMERINGTTHYLSNNRKIIYDVVFADLYFHNKKIPENHIVVDNTLLKIEDWCHIDEEERFLEILKREPAKSVGMQIFLDDKLYMSNVPFSKSESLRNELLYERNHGIIYFFSCLKVKDPSGNVTEFHTQMTSERCIAKGKALHGK